MKRINNFTDEDRARFKRLSAEFGERTAKRREEEAVKKQAAFIESERNSLEARKRRQQENDRWERAASEGRISVLGGGDEFNRVPTAYMYDSPVSAPSASATHLFAHDMLGVSEEEFDELWDKAEQTRITTATKNWIENYISEQKRHEELMSYDLDIGKAKIDRLERMPHRSALQEDIYKAEKTKYDEASHYQEMYRVYNDPKFNEYVNAALEYDNPTYAQLRVRGTDRPINMVRYFDATMSHRTAGELTIQNDPAGTFPAMIVMTDAEKDIYNYYFGRAEYEKADEYLESIRDILVRRYHAAGGESYSAMIYGKESPALATLASVYTNGASGFEFIGDAAKYVFTGGESSMRNSLAAKTAGYRSGASADMPDWGKFLYNTGMSIVDSATASMAGPLAPVMFFTPAAASATNDALDRGMSPTRSLFNGLSAGFFEMLFEKVSLGNFRTLKEVPISGFTDTLKNMAKSVGVNASEEVFTDIANIAYDTLVNGEYANYTLDELAKGGTWIDILGQLLETGLSGALTGAAFGTAGNITANSTIKSKYGDKHKQIALVAQGLSRNEGSRAYKLAEQNAAKLANGRKLSGRDIRYQLGAMSRQDALLMDDYLITRFKEMGIDDVKYREAFTKFLRGEKLSIQEDALVAAYEAETLRLLDEIGRLDMPWAKGTIAYASPEVTSMAKDDGIPIVPGSAADVGAAENKAVPFKPDGDLTEAENVPEPMAIPEPVTVPEPMAIPEPVTVPEPMAIPEPVTVPETATVPETVTVPDSTSSINDAPKAEQDDPTFGSMHITKDEMAEIADYEVPKIDGSEIYFVTEDGDVVFHPGLMDYIQTHDVTFPEPIRRALGITSRADAELMADADVAAAVADMDAVPDDTSSINDAPKAGKSAISTVIERELSDVPSQVSVSADGKTVLAATGEAVSVSEIRSVKDGKVSLLLDDGRVVDASALSYASREDGLIYEMVSDMSVTTANTFISDYSVKGSDVSLNDFALAWETAYEYGFRGFDDSEIYGDTSLASALTPEQARHAFAAGRADMRAANAGRQAAIDKAKAEAIERSTAKASEKVAVKSETKKQKLPKPSVKGRVHFGNNVSANTKVQKASVQGLRALSQALNIDIYIYDSKHPTSMREKNSDGWYDPGDNSIHIDIHSGKDARGTMMYTVSHELVHMIKRWSPDKYRKLADFLVEQYGKKGISVESLVEAQIERAKKQGDKLTESEAFDEVIADSCERMLLDSDAFIKLADFAAESAENKSIVKKIVDYIKSLLAALRDIYKGYDPNSFEADIVSEMVDVAEELHALFEDALMDTAETSRLLGDDASSGDAEVQMARKSANDKSEQARQKRIEQTQAEVTAHYHTAVDKVIAGTYKSSDSILMGYTPKIFRELGVPSLPFVINADHVYSIAVSKNKAVKDGRYDKKVHYHDLGVQKVKDLYKLIQDPVMIVVPKSDSKSEKDRRTVHSVVEIIDVGTSGEQIYMPVRITARRNIDGVRLDVNALSTAFDGDVESLVKEAAAKTNIGEIGVYYKKGGGTKSLAAGHHRPTHPNSQATPRNGIIHLIPEKVNMTTDDVTKSSQFTEWFGDWQNHPNDASRVVNADGTPQVVYLVSKSESKKIHKVGEGDVVNGIYMTTSEKAAYKAAGDDGYVYENYANLRNPYIINASGSGKNNIPPPKLMINENPKLAGTKVDINAVVDFAKRTGRDGVIIRNLNDGGNIADGIVAFSSNQVKSVDNIGTFDNRKNNSMYSRKSADDQSAMAMLDKAYKEYAGIESTPSDRELIANALETLTVNPAERELIAKYKQGIEKMNAEEEKLHSLKAVLKALSFSEGKRDKARIKEVREEITATQNRIQIYDDQLLRLESAGALRNIIASERAKAAKSAMEKASIKAKETDARWREKKLVRMNRERIIRLAKRIDRLYTKATKENNVKEEERKLASNATALAKVLFSEEVNERDLASLDYPYATEKELLDLARYRELVTKQDELKAEISNAVESEADERGITAKEPSVDINSEGAELEAINREITSLEELLGPLFDRKQKELGTIKITDFIEDLAKDYSKLAASDVGYIKAAYDKESYDYLMGLAQNKELDGKTAKDMTSSELETVYEAFSIVANAIYRSNKLFNEGKSAGVTSSSHTVMDEVSKAFKKEKSSNEVLQLIGNVVKWDNLKPETAIELLGSDELLRLYRNMQDGEEVYAVDMKEATDYKDSLVEKYGADKWNRTELYEFTTDDGATFELTLGQCMSIYALSRRLQADEHLRIGGIVPKKIVDKLWKKKKAEVKKSLKDGKADSAGEVLALVRGETTSYKVSEELIDVIVSKLSADQKSFVKDMQKYLSEDMAAKGNEVSMKLYGIKLFKETCYFSLQSAPQYMIRNFEAMKGEKKIKNKGFTQKTVDHARNPIVIDDFMDVWAGHVNEMSQYHALTLPMEDFTKVYGYIENASDETHAVSVRAQIENVHGKNATRYIDTFLEQLNGGVRRESAGAYEQLVSLSKKSAVLASLSVVVQQPTAGIRAMLYTGVHPFGKITRAEGEKLWDELQRYAPIATIKDMGRFDTNMSRSAVDQLAGSKTSYGKVMNKVDNFFGWAAEKADKVTWCAIWKSCQRKVYADNKSLKLGSEANKQAAAKLFTEVIRKTQVYDSVFSRTQAMRSKNPFHVFSTAFMSEPMTIVDMVVRASYKGDKKFFAQTIAVVFISHLVNSAVKSVVYAARDDDEDETYLEKYLQALTSSVMDGLNPFTYIPFAKDIWSLIEGYDVERTDMALIGDLIDAIKGWGDDNKRLDRKIIDSVGAVTAIFPGIPVNNLARDAYGIVNFFATLTNGIPDTGLGTYQAFMNALRESFLMKPKSKSAVLYEAVMTDSEHLERMRATYKTEDSYESALRKALREYDPRIAEAAKARALGNLGEYEAIVGEIIGEGNFDKDLIIGAVNTEYDKLTDNGEESSEDKNKAVSIWSASDIGIAFDSGDIDGAYAIISELIEVKIANYVADGKAPEEAEKEAKKSLKSSVTKAFKEAYKAAYADGDDSEMERIEGIIFGTGLYEKKGSVRSLLRDWEDEYDEENEE